MFPSEEKVQDDDDDDDDDDASFICSSCLSVKQFKVTFRRQMATLLVHIVNMLYFEHLNDFIFHILIWRLSLLVFFTCLQGQTSCGCV